MVEEFYVPPVASAGTIFVVTNSEIAEIRYYDADGDLVPTDGLLSGAVFSDNEKGSTYTLLFQDSGPVTQTLLVTRPITGTWRVEVDTEPGAKVTLGMTFTGEADLKANASPETHLPATRWPSPGFFATKTAMSSCLVRRRDRFQRRSFWCGSGNALSHSWTTARAAM